MNSNTADYTCPYCRWSKSRSWSAIREEEELVNREYVGQNFNKTYYLDTKRKFNVKICPKCHKALKVRSYIIWTLFALMIIATAVTIVVSLIRDLFPSDTLEHIGHGSVYVLIITVPALVLFWLLWKILGPARAHVKFDRAKNCNALAPVDSN